MGLYLLHKHSTDYDLDNIKSLKAGVKNGSVRTAQFTRAVGWQWWCVVTISDDGQH